MKLGFRLVNPQRLVALTVIVHAANAAAQDPEPAPAPAPAPAAEAPVTTVVAPPPDAPASVVNEPTLAPPAPLAPVVDPPEPAPSAKEPEEEAPPINISFWGRVDTTLSSLDTSPPVQPAGDSLKDVYSTADFQLHTSGRVYGIVSYTANIVATYNPDVQGTAGLLDGIIQIEPSDYFNVWLGRMLVPVDRSNFSGYWFAAPWHYPGFGFVDGQVTAPLEGPFGRNDGATVWGQVGGGMFKYYLGVFDLHNVEQSPLFSGRLALALLDPEPGYYNSSTYYGKDILSIGAGFHAKKDGTSGTNATTGLADTDTYTELNVDVLFEKNFAGAGVLDLEGALYKFGGDYQRTDLGWYGVASYLLPNAIGPGKLQPLVRVQQALPTDDVVDETSTLIDAQLGYVVNSYATRFALGYRRGSAGDLDVQALYFGAQIMK
jgi:hypothetical protein